MVAVPNEGLILDQETTYLHKISFISSNFDLELKQSDFKSKRDLPLIKYNHTSKCDCNQMCRICIIIKETTFLHILVYFFFFIKFNLGYSDLIKFIFFLSYVTTYPSIRLQIQNKVFEQLDTKMTDRSIQTIY